jgi:hypothetical protein
MECFQYEPLKPDCSEIRLVEVLPSDTFEGTICCNLVHASLNDTVKFLPLSYTWGAPYASLSSDWDNPEVTRTITMNKKSFQVRLNLESALRHIRTARKATTTLWIDAICINQLDTEERNSQVQLMRSIYSKGEDTVIWLGPQENDSKLAFGKMSEIMSSRLARISNQQKPDHDPQYCASLLKEEIGSDEHCWHAIRSIFSRNWWNRAWIFQEAIVSQSAILLCGSSFLWWDAIVQTVSLIHEISHDEDMIPDKLVESISGVAHRSVQVLNLIGYWKEYRCQQSRPRALIETLSSLRNLYASDPKDKVYAGLGLTTERLIDIDYSLETHQIYTSLAGSYITKFQNLDILDYCVFPEGKSDLPTWVPDWRVKNHSSPFFKSSHHHGEGWTYAASGRRRLETSMTGSPPTLIVKGSIITTIEALGEKLHFRPPGPERTTKESIDDHWRQILQWQRIANAYLEAIAKVESLHIHDARGHHIKYPYTYDTISRAFQKTLFADVRLTDENEYMSRLSDNVVDAEDMSDISKIPEAWDSRNAAALNLAITGRRFFISRDAYIGLGPDAAEEGDSVCIISGAEVLHVVRHVEGHKYLFIGECYAHGLMDGQAIELVEEGKLKMMDIELI